MTQLLVPDILIIKSRVELLRPIEELAHISMGQASEQPARSLDLAEKPTAPLGATTSSKVNDQHELLF